MGVRVARLDFGQDSTVENYVTFQSVSDQMFRPMFDNELAAWLFAHGMAHHSLLSIGEMEVGSDVIRFVRRMLVHQSATIPAAPSAAARRQNSYHKQ